MKLTNQTLGRIIVAALVVWIAVAMLADDAGRFYVKEDGVVYTSERLVSSSFQDAVEMAWKFKRWSEENTVPNKVKPQGELMEVNCK